MDYSLETCKLFSKVYMSDDKKMCAGVVSREENNSPIIVAGSRAHF
jgi:hypothetical protein